MSVWFAPISRWLVEVYAMSTCVLVASGIAMLVLRQPVRRLAVARATFLALAALGPIAAACGWLRVAGIREPTPSDAAESKWCEVLIVCAPPSQVAIRPLAIGCDEDSSTAPRIPRFPEDAATDRAVVGFAIGSAGMMGWLLLGVVASIRLGRAARPAPAHLEASLREIVGGGRRMPRLRVASCLAQPIAIGAIRQTIVLPSQFVDEEPESRVKVAMAHEWAHLRNGDLRLLAISRWLLPLYFAHPLYVWMRGRVRDDQEALADAHAAEISGRIAYAEALLAWSRQGVSRKVGTLAPSLGLWSRPSHIRGRITRLLDREFVVERSSPRCWQVLLYGTICAGIAILAAGSVLRAAPAAHDCSRCTEHNPVPVVASLLCPTNISR